MLSYDLVDQLRIPEHKTCIFFLFFDEFNQPCRMLMAASRSSSEFAQGKQWWCKSSHLPWLWCPIPGPCVTCGFTLFLVHFLAPMIFFSNFILCPSTTEPDTSKFYLREVTQLRSKLATGYSYFTSLTINSDRSGQGSNKEPFNLSS